MGFAKNKMDSDVRAQIAAELFTVKSTDNQRDELIGLCPIHGETNPSFAYNIEKDVYNCSSCQATGDLVDLWCHVNGHNDKKDGFKAFCRAHQIGRDDGDGKAAPRAAKKSKKKKDVPVIPESVWEQMQPLPEDFIKRLYKTRGWTREAITLLDLRLQTVYLDKDGETIRKVSRAERVAIPIRNDNGQLINIRLYKPGAKVGKIMSWGKGYGSAALFPAQPLNITEPVLVCEGEPDTICAISKGLNAITQTSKLVNWPTDHKYQMAGRDIVFAYDGDQAGQDYAWKGAHSLSEVAKTIAMLQWPEFMGCIFGYWPLNHGEDLTDYFQTHSASIEDFKALKKKTSVTGPVEKKKEEKSQSKDEVQRPLGGEEFFHMNNQGRWTFKPRWLADHICDELQIMYEPLTSRMYRYNDTYWEDFQEEHLEAKAVRFLGDESTSSRAGDAAKQAKLLSILPHGRETNDSGMMCLENGMLDLSQIHKGEVELKKHRKNYFATYQLPISFTDTGEKKCDRWMKFLAETIQTPEVILQVQEYAGYCLTRETRYGKALLLLGPGSDGKSKFIEVIEQLVGERNTTSLSMNDLEDQFYRSGLYNKMLCTSTEISKEYFNSAYFKAIVTGDTISAAHKNKDPFEFKPFCKLVFAGNDLPRSRDNSDGYFRRLLPIRFKKQFFGDEEDTHLAEKLRAELPMILNWALAGLIRLLDQDGFTKSAETDAMLYEYRRDNNPVMSFVDEKCLMGETYQVDKDGLYRKYRDFCNQYNYRALNRVHFYRELVTAKKNLQMTRPRVDGKRVNMIDGIGLIVDDNG